MTDNVPLCVFLLQLECVSDNEAKVFANKMLSTLCCIISLP